MIMHMSFMPSLILVILSISIWLLFARIDYRCVMSNRVGAPLGGRVHWLLLNLSGNFKVNHTLSYNYKTHCYTFYRYTGQRNKRIVDVYIIIRTSKRCFKLMYNNLMQDIYITKS